MERVDYRMTDADEGTCEGKFEAILKWVCDGNHKSDVIPAYGTRVIINYDPAERAALEPTVLAIINNADHTFWDLVSHP